MATDEGSTTQLVSIKDGNTINMPFTKQNRTIEEIDGNDSEVDKFSVIDVNSIKTLKSLKFKDLV